MLSSSRSSPVSTISLFGVTAIVSSSAARLFSIAARSSAI
jgi:hypothetical protein